jgi:hypothetical protein
MDVPVEKGRGRARLEGMGMTSTREQVAGVDGGGRGPGPRREGWGCRRGRMAWSAVSVRSSIKKLCVCSVVRQTGAVD